VAARSLPFSAALYLPLETMSWTPLVIMALASGALAWIGIHRFVRHDVQPG
jgi:ABC-2 type transport system permease protein